MASKLDELCDEVIAARAARDELKAQLHACEEALQAMEAKLAGELGEDKLTHGDFAFSSAMKVSWKTLKSGREHLVTLLKSGVPELVKESVNSASLNAYLRKNETQLEAESAEWWNAAKACVERTEILALSVRKVPKKKN